MSLFCSDVVVGLERELNKIYHEYCQDIQKDPDKFNAFCEEINILPRRYAWMKEHFTERELEERNVKAYIGNEKYPLWNVIDHDFLDFLIEYCGGSAKLQNKMASFKEKVKRMCTTMTIQDFIAQWDPVTATYFDDDDIPADIIKHMERLKWDPKVHRLSELQKIRIKTKSRISQKIGIAAYVLVELRPGSVMAIWLVYPNNIVPERSREIIELVQESTDYYQSSGILWVIFKDFFVYPITNQNMVRKKIQFIHLKS